jgi:hypothetical protein
LKHQQITSNNDSNLPVLTASGNRLRYYFLNIFVLISVIYLVTKYNENPTLITVLIGILVFIFLPFSFVEYLFAENDKLIVLYKSVFFLQFLNRKRIFKYDEIKKITATLKNDEKTDITAFSIDLTTKFTAMSFNVLEVEMKNGKIKYINSKIFIAKLLPIINFMQKKGVDIQIIYPDIKDI